MVKHFWQRAGAVFVGVALLGAVAAQAAEPIKIGLSMSLTGGLAGGGKSALLGMQVWAEDVNAKGGLLGRPVQLVFYDDQSTGANVPGIYSKLLEVDKVDLVVSGYATNQIVPAMPIVMQKNLVFMALFGTGVNDKFHYDKYFQILPNGKETRLGPSEGFLATAMTMEPKPKTIALAAADAEYAQTVIAGAREKIKELGLQIVYDRSYPPATVDFAPVVRSIAAANPDIVYIASYPPDSVGMVRAAHEAGLKARMFGGGMIGLAFAPVKQQLGPLLNGIVSYDVYVPEPTMKFPGIEEFLTKYRVKAVAEGVDPLGFYLPPFAYAELQILAEAITKTGGLDQEKIAAYIHANPFET
ncbi:MAG: amino acid ABC transporter substrate-binding protein, partial [Stellaceae bacterium]